MAIARVSGEAAVLVSPEQRLWRAAIKIALQDAVGIVYGVSSDKCKRGRGGKKIAVLSAVSFFERGGYNGRELPLVCDLAGLDIERIRRAAMQAIRLRWGDSPSEAVRITSGNEFTRGNLEVVAQKAGWCGPVVMSLLTSTRHEGS